jgi:N-acyl-D-aspartate/D-glutamate deacylase
MKYDVLIKGGTVIDGTGAPRRIADIAIKDGRIDRIAPAIPGDAARVVDATGLIVAPGVVDPHTHYDAQINWDPYCTSTGWHGGTTVVVGNCGFGFMPCRPEDRERYMLMMENTEQVPMGAMRKALSWNWDDFPSWAAHMRQLPKGINIASYLPLNSLMIYVMGYEAAKTRGATPAERARMRDLLNEAMDNGAIGFALSHLGTANTHKDIDGSPMPTDIMNIEDAYCLADVLRERGQGVIQALVDLPGVNNRHVAEELARRSGRPVIQNVIAAFDMMPDFHRSVIRWLDEMSAKGLDIYSQSLSFRAWTEFNAHDYNAWAHIEPFYEFTHAGDAAAKAGLAADPTFRERARAIYTPESMVEGGGAVETFILAKANGAAAWAQFEGRLLSEVARWTGKPALECFFDIIAESACKADFRTTDATSMDIAKHVEIFAHPRTLPGTSDGGAHIKFFSGGHFSTDLIAWLGREEKVASLEALHHKMSMVPARVLGLHERGALIEGWAADLFCYDFDRIGYDATSYAVVRDLPDGDWRRVVLPRGIAWSMANGEIITENGKTTGATPGRLVGNAGAGMDERLAQPLALAAE